MIHLGLSILMFGQFSVTELLDTLKGAIIVESGFFKRGFSDRKKGKFASPDGIKSHRLWVHFAEFNVGFPLRNCLMNRGLITGAHVLYMGLFCPRL